MTCKSVAVKIPVSITEAPVNAVVPYGVKILAHKKCGFCAPEHIAVHTVSTHHDICAKPTCIEKSNFIVQIAFSILHHPGRAVADNVLLIFTQVKAMPENGLR